MRIALLHAHVFTIDFQWLWVINRKIGNCQGMLKAIHHALMIALCCVFCLKMRTYAITCFFASPGNTPPLMCQFEPFYKAKTFELAHKGGGVHPMLM
jgi:hypothetical protein